MTPDVVSHVFADYVTQPRWIGWKYELKNGRENKSPINPFTGAYASSTDPKTWATFDIASNATEKFQCTGLGIILGRGLGGVDLDGCRNPDTGALTPWAQEIIRDFKSYAEVSPSKTGVKIWAAGAPKDLPANTIPMSTPPIKGKAAKVEVFTHSRYFAVTGEVLESVPDEIANCGDYGGAWDRLITRLATQQRPGTAVSGSLQMSEALKGAIQQRESLRLLWNSGKDGGKDRSRNDASLASTLGALGFPDNDIEAALRSYTLGQIGQGSITGTTADRQIVRLLGLAAAARPKQITQAVSVESDVRRVSDVRAAVQELYKTGLQPGESPGWFSLKQHWTLRKGEWTLITGIPSHGKSSFVDAVMVNLARYSNWSWAIWSGENLPHEVHIANLLEQYTGKPFNQGYLPRMSPAEVDDGLKFIDDHFVFLAPPEDEETPGRFLAATEKAMELRPIHGLVVDPWNELTHNYNEDRQSETEYISRELKRVRRFASRHQIHVIIVAHPKKLQKEGGKYPVPTPYDVSSSAHWRNKADCALCVWRDEDRPGETVIYIQKIRRRFVGKLGRVELRYDVATGKYREWDTRQPGDDDE